MNDLYVLGINAYHGDASAALLRNGELVVALEEERFRRVKHWAGFPAMSIGQCLQIAGIDGTQVSHVAIGRNPRANLLRKASYSLRRRPSLALIQDRLRNQARVMSLSDRLHSALDLPSGKALPSVHYVEHHPAHLASTFFVSPFRESAVCAIDGFGDFVSTSFAHGHGGKIDVLDRVYFPHSLGLMYTAVTQYLGFPHYGDEFKVMGLAPYGAPEVVHELRKLVRKKSVGRFELDLKYFTHWNSDLRMQWDDAYPTLGRVFSSELERLLGPARTPDEPLTPYHENVAHSLQVVFEEMAFHVLNGLWDRIGSPRLCLSGGCAMNSVSNGKVRQNTRFEELYIQPAAGDNGTALGAAFHVWNQVLGNDRKFVVEHAYWGGDYAVEVEPLVAKMTDVEWEYSCRRFGSFEETCQATARLIADGNVVGWFQGRMEWGARALGNRSILADPRRVDMRELINTKIKFREKFRPFAPSIAEEALDDYFVGAAADPFMLQVYPVREDKRSVLPAITHVDGSGRLQTVSERTNPRYYALIKAFEALTGVPVLLNTSFNENEPIVDTPDQALDCFRRTRMDAIVVNDTLVERRPAASAKAIA
jgi:carbamoyltransferase